MPAEERAIQFDCLGSMLYGVLHVPEHAATRALLVVTGGPQYRAGSHRQFVLLGRELARCGVPVLRFDYRGMGDSEGTPRSFEAVDDDIASAAAALVRELPEVREFVLWGLCDGATAAALYAPCDVRVRGLVLANPWIRSEASEAQAMVRHYYGKRLLQGAFWRKLLGGSINPWRAAADLLRAVWRGRVTPPAEGGIAQRMLGALQQFEGHVLLVSSGADLTAREFDTVVSACPNWRRALARVRLTRRELHGANHTFAQRVWRDQVARWTADWIRSW
jgi:exosortase A-associated hydrolase 1